VNHDLSRNPGYAGFAYTGHAIETFWMLMREAVRRKDRALWNITVERFRRHVEVAWDDVYGGAFRALYDVDRNLWATDKVSWLQEEILIGAMIMIGHAGDLWAGEQFGRTWEYVLDNFALKRHGFPLWNYHTNRKAEFERHAGTIEMFHHPRHLMENIITLEALEKRGGKITGIFV
jgi:mannose/cellobiose epimerase-like protein (N-acyl-D-glucosamine 2-epimerase family)